MKNFKRKLSALVLSTLFASMQVSYAVIDTGLGAGNGGAVINNTTGGFAGINGAGTGNVDLNFNGNAHVNWNTLNVNKGESLNFNATNGANGLTVLNTVNQGMSNIYGQINANQGISQLIISNPNGVLFDGAQFTTAGDAMITTKDLSGLSVNDLNNFDINNANYSKIFNGEGKLIPIQIKNNSTFNVGGDYSIVAAGINAANSTITAKAVKLVTANGQDYLALGQTAPAKAQTVAKLSAMNVNGDLYITNDVGALEIQNGGTINGNTNVVTSGNVSINKTNNGNKLNMNGDVKVVNNGARAFLRNADVKGNLEMVNGGGFIDIGDIHVAKNAKLTTKDVSQNYDNNCYQTIKHFVHVIGDTKVDGDLAIESKHNIHIGGYDYDAQKLADGKLTVGGDLTAHSTDGHVMTTVDTSANKITMKSDNLNVLTDGKATLTAKEYKFSSNGYLGGLTTTDAMTVDQKVVNIMENYIPVPDTVGTPGYINVNGGTISQIDTPSTAYISSKADLKVTGANAKEVNLVAPDKYIEITGPDVHADTIKVGKATNKLKVDFPGRDYTLKYTNIRDEKEVTVRKDDVITYELTNAPNGYNDGTQIAGKSTYLVGPDAPDVPPTPPVDPEPQPIPDDNDNAKVLRSFENKSLDLNQVYTPVAYAADLDDDKNDTGVRKNVDGSVTVVRAFPMIN